MRDIYDKIIFENTFSKSVEATKSSYEKQSLTNNIKSKLGQQYTFIASEYLKNEVI